MGQLMQLSDQLERARSQYDSATAQLAQIQRDLRENKHELQLAKLNLRASQRDIAKRLVALYTTNETSTLEVILGAKSLDDAMTRLDNEKSLTSLDAAVLQQVKRFKAQVKDSGRRLAFARHRQQQVVAQRAAAKQAIESKLAQSQSLLSSIKGQIAQLEAQQAARQAALARAAQLRYEQQRLASQQQSESTVVGISATAPSADQVVLPPPTHGNVVSYALSQLGTPYVWGGGAPGGFDCSGLVMWAYAQVGVSLPHSSYAMWNYGVPVSRDQLMPGDILFFDGLGHVGLYIGNGEFVDAPHTGAVVEIASLSEGWYSASFVGARRI